MEIDHTTINDDCYGTHRILSHFNGIFDISFRHFSFRHELESLGSSTDRINFPNSEILILAPINWCITNIVYSGVEIVMGDTGSSKPLPKVQISLISML